MEPWPGPEVDAREIVTLDLPSGWLPLRLWMKDVKLGVVEGPHKEHVIASYTRWPQDTARPQRPTDASISAFRYETVESASDAFDFMTDLGQGDCLGDVPIRIGDRGISSSSMRAGNRGILKCEGRDQRTTLWNDRLIIKVSTEYYSASGWMGGWVTIGWSDAVLKALADSWGKFKPPDEQ